MAANLEKIGKVFGSSNTEYQSPHHRARKDASQNDQKVKFLVLHYTGVPLWTTLGIFTNNYDLAKRDADYFVSLELETLHEKMCKNEVSVHYVISETGERYQLVNENRAAYHAGVSYWNGVENINNQSIGIEHVNIGYNWLSKFPDDRGFQSNLKIKDKKADLDIFETKVWCQFTEEQILKTILLCQEIIKRHDIKPYNVVGHADISCGRKFDPGPAFPWEKLAKAGVGLWYDLSESKINTGNLNQQMPVSVDGLDGKVIWFQKKLLEFGYGCPQTGQLDEATQNVIQSFQMHFRVGNIDGNIDLECIQILDSLCQRKLKCIENPSMFFSHLQDLNIKQQAVVLSNNNNNSNNDINSNDDVRENKDVQKPNQQGFSCSNWGDKI